MTTGLHGVARPLRKTCEGSAFCDATLILLGAAGPRPEQPFAFALLRPLPRSRATKVRRDGLIRK